MGELKLSKESWSSQTVFILAAIGSAVGLGNLWKFPYITGENGGGAFVIVYLACILLIGLPILMAEVALGRSGKANPPQAMANLAREAGASKLWALLGFNGVLAGVLILSFYTVIAGWSLAYFFDSLTGQFVDINAEQAKAHFSGLIGSAESLILWHSLIMILTIFIVSRGVKAGIEKAIYMMMPGLAVILMVLLGYATTTGGFMQSFHFLFDPDFSALTWQSVLIALGTAFFTLSLGMGAMMVYGSYLGKDHSIVRASLWIVFADTLIALLAGLVIFSIVFGNGMEASSGPGLLFETLPIAFGHMTGGWFFGTLFFVMVVFAALSSAISIAEPVISWMEQNWGIARRQAGWMLGLFVWVVGLGTVFSFNIWSDVHFLGERTFFDSLDFIASNIQLPLGGLFIALFVAWIWNQPTRDREVGISEDWSLRYAFLLKWVAPVAVMFVFVSNLVSSDDIYWALLVAVALYALFIFWVKRKQA